MSLETFNPVRSSQYRIESTPLFLPNTISAPRCPTHDDQPANTDDRATAQGKIVNQSKFACQLRHRNFSFTDAPIRGA